MPRSLLLLLSESEVAAVEPSGAGLRVRLSAACVLQRARGGHGAPVQGYSQGVVLELPQARVTEDTRPLLGRLVEGRLEVAGQWQRDIPVPYAAGAPVRLQLAFAHRGAWTVEATDVRIGFEGPENFRESLAC
jgi:hypothetical protein